MRLKDRIFSENIISDLIDEYILNYDISLPSMEDTTRNLYKPKSIVYQMVSHIMKEVKSDVEKSYDGVRESLKSGSGRQNEN
ncbi:hypothetical protein OK016_16400 [Vibrio chagasii]|nr:hypothetical protein [Vibrio chagasii]